jgi:hypothetical protein
MPFPPSGQSPAWYGVTSSPQLKSPVSFSLGSMCRADLMQLSGLSRARIIDTHFTGQEKGGKCVNPGFPEFIAVPQHIIASSHVPVQTDSPGRGNSSDAWVLTCCPTHSLTWSAGGELPVNTVSRSPGSPVQDRGIGRLYSGICAGIIGKLILSRANI